MQDKARSANNEITWRPNALDVVPPAQIARLVEYLGVRKANLSLVQSLHSGRSFIPLL